MPAMNRHIRSFVIPGRSRSEAQAQTQGSMPERCGSMRRRATSARLAPYPCATTVPAWILGSRSAARRLPEDDETQKPKLLISPLVGGEERSAKRTESQLLGFSERQTAGRTEGGNVGRLRGQSVPVDATEASR